jgi:hypothetical protein
VSACLEYLHTRKIVSWRNNTGAVKYKNASGASRFLRFGCVGSSDIIGWMPDGRFLAVECKAKGGKLSDAQCDFISGLNRSGGVAIVAYSVDDVIKRIEEVKA